MTEFSFKNSKVILTTVSSF